MIGLIANPWDVDSGIGAGAALTEKIHLTIIKKFVLLIL